MSLRVVGAGAPRTATASQKRALERLLGGTCYHMSVIPGHPFDLGADWNQALGGDPVAWRRVIAGYAAAVDWPASLFWREISAAYPDALVLLSARDSSTSWYESMDATVLSMARKALAPDWDSGRDLVDLLERFTNSSQWDDPKLLMDAYERHVADVRASVPPERLLEWRPEDGWEPICHALGLPVPTGEFPWLNRRKDWG